jgi:hypothetical protein
MLLALLGTAWANGQTTHVWITRHALEHLPEGDLLDILSDPANEPMLINGGMFPDGGYAVDHPYGEAGHWEPLQGAYLDWIADNQGLPLTTTGEQHLSFLMGTASHGMADQVFDALYMERSKVYDAEQGWTSGESMDEATDVIWALIEGPEEVPELWLPHEQLVPLYAEQGIEVDAETLENGQTLLGAAIDLVGLFSTSEQLVEGYEAEFPWATSHLHDEVDVSGAPRCEGEVVALYWLTLWERIQGQAGPNRVLATWPPHNGDSLPTDAAVVESRISLMFSTGLVADTVSPEDFTVSSAEGEHEVDVWVFYGNDSHVVHLIPQEDWPEDSWITVEVRGEGIEDNRGGLALDHAFSVSTSRPQEPTAELPVGCSTARARGSWLGPLGLLGLLGLLGRRSAAVAWARRGAPRVLGFGARRGGEVPPGGAPPGRA